MKRSLFAVLLFTIVWIFAQTANSDRVIQGKVWHSFDDELCVIESGSMFYYLSKKSMSVDSAQKLRQIGAEVSVVVPERAIKFVESTKLQRTEAQNKSPKERVEVKSGRINMKGRLLPSTENAASIAIENFVYRVDSNYIAPAAMPGEFIDVTMPVAAIKSVYELPQNIIRNHESDEPRGITVVSETEYNLRGEVLYSFTDAFVLLKVGNFIYRLQRGFLTTAQAAQLSHIGSDVNITVPASSIDSSWSYDDGNSQRMPASK